MSPRTLLSVGGRRRASRCVYVRYGRYLPLRQIFELGLYCRALGYSRPRVNRFDLGQIFAFAAKPFVLGHSHHAFFWMTKCTREREIIVNKARAEARVLNDHLTAKQKAHAAARNARRRVAMRSTGEVTRTALDQGAARARHGNCAHRVAHSACLPASVHTGLAASFGTHGCAAAVPRCKLTARGCAQTSNGACTTRPRVPTTCACLRMCSTGARSCTGIFAGRCWHIPTDKTQQRPALGGSAMGDAALGGIGSTSVVSSPPNGTLLSTCAGRKCAQVVA